jgi:hypothetical protein
MWMPKGVLLGVWLVSFGTIGFLSFAHYHKLPDVVTRVTIGNPVWWLWWMMGIAIGLIVARSWRGNRVVWIGLAVTELAPLALLMLGLMNELGLLR